MNTNEPGTDLVPVTAAGDYLPSVEDIDRAVAVYDKIRLEAKKRLIEGKDGDYGIIPGTNKPTLFQAGAEKLCNFFGFAVEVTTVGKEMDFKEKWAEFHGRCVLRSKKSGEIVAVAEASINSHEVKYYYQLFPEQNPDVTKRDKTPVRLADLMNTLEAMAQKRALVKATRHATGLSDMFTQDTEDMPTEALAGNGGAGKQTTAQPGATTGSHNIEKRISSKYDNAKCGFCGERHIVKGSEIVLCGGKWGAEICLKHQEPTSAPTEADPSDPMMGEKQIAHLDELFAKNYDSKWWNEFKKMFPNYLTNGLYNRYVDALTHPDAIGDIEKYFAKQVSELASKADLPF